MRKKLAVVIPVYNEEESIKKVVNDWKKILPTKLFDLIIINDGSTDNTKSILSNFKKKIKNLIVINKKNAGHGKAVCDGYKFAIKKNINIFSRLMVITNFLHQILKNFGVKKVIQTTTLF